MREVRSKAEADFRRAQVCSTVSFVCSTICQKWIRRIEDRALLIRYEQLKTAESTSHTTSTKYNALAKDHQDSENRFANERLDLERRLRKAQEDNRSLREEAEEAKSDLASLERQSARETHELESRHTVLQSSVDEIKAERDAKVTALQNTQKQLEQRDGEIAQLQSEALRLRAQAGDSDTLSIIKRELSEQVAHIKKLEGANREQMAELKQYRKQRKNVEVVEEEKRALEQKLRLMEDLRRELCEAQLRQQVLEDERRSWAAYLESGAFQEEGMDIKSPEDMARAFLRERLEKAGLVEKLGVLQPELSVKDDNIRALEEEKAQLTKELEKARSSTTNTGSASDAKIRARLERQRVLASKEVEYLRAQLKAFDAEESEFQSEKYDEAKSERISELESLIDEHRNEIQTLHKDLTNLEQAAALSASVSQKSTSPTAPAKPGTKRTHDSDSGPSSEPEDHNQRVGETLRRNRKLQDDLHASQTRISVLTAELDALRKQLSALQSSSRTRILELRSNPTNDAAAIKQATLNVLRDENEALRAQLEKMNSHNKNNNDHNSNNQPTSPNPSSSSSSSPSPPLIPLVPAATVATLKHDLAEQHRLAAQQAKRTDRLKKQWTALAADFRDVAASLLGWRLEFLDGKRVRVSSVFHPGDTPDENSIVFDSRQGTMKVSGGRESVFAGEIRELMDEWVDGKKVIPCFLAAVTLEFWGRGVGVG